MSRASENEVNPPIFPWERRLTIGKAIGLVIFLSLILLAIVAGFGWLIGGTTGATLGR